MKNWSVSKFAIVGFVAGFVLNCFGPFLVDLMDWSWIDISLKIGMLTAGVITGILGMIMAIIAWNFFRRKIVGAARGLIWGATLYCGLKVGLTFFDFFLFGSEPFLSLSFLPDYPFGWPLCGILKSLFVGGNSANLWNPYILCCITVTSWLSYAFIGAIIGYLIEKRKARMVMS